MKRIYLSTFLLVILSCVRLNAQCQAGFSFTQSNDTITFTDTSSSLSGTVDTWSWNFGNSTSSTLQNPVVTYGTCGMYIVTLNISTSGACASTFTDTVYVADTLNAAFNFVSSPGNNSVQFTASQLAPHIQYGWNFGDGNTATGDTVTNVYAATGNYNACVILSDINGVCTPDTNCAAITIFPPCAAGFSYAVIGDSVSFSDTTSAPGDTISNWTWTFGDLSGSINQNPGHTYASCGTYTAQLSITTSSGCSSTYSDTIDITTSITGAYSYSVNPTNGNADFVASPVGGNYLYAWDLGNGNLANGDTVNTNYTNGTYSVCVIISDTNGVCANDTVCNAITVSLTPTCQASFTFTSTGDTVSFTDASSVTNDTIASWVWAFGDLNSDTIQNPVHVYPGCGTYIASLTITTNNNCTSTFADTISIGGQINAAYTYSVNATSGSTSFSATPVNGNFSYAWDFGDGNTGSGSSASNTYANGTYFACVIISDTNNICVADTFCDSISVTILPCHASFTYSLSGTTATFTNTSSTQSGTILNNFWNFGDFTTSAQVNPVHTYNTCGIYIVNLSIVTSNGCTNTYSDTLTIPGQVNGNYTYSLDSTTGTVQFFATPNNSNYTFAWDFGDGNTGAGANPSNVYSPGTYYACVIINHVSGACVADTICDSVMVVVGTPTCTVSWTNFASGTFQTFTANPFNFGDTYDWDFGDGNLGTGAFTTHTYATPGTYTVCVTMTDQQGCTALFCDTVDIPACSLDFTWTGTDGDITFTATVAGGGFIPVVGWSFGDGGTGVGTTTTHQYTTNGFKLVCAILNPPPVPGCSDTICKLVYIVGVGIEESVFDNSLTLSPNPFEDQITIHFNLTSNADVSVSIFDVPGNKIADVAMLKDQSGVQEIKYSTSDLASGIYFVKIKAGDKTVTRKIIKR